MSIRWSFRSHVVIIRLVVPTQRGKHALLPPFAFAFNFICLLSLRQSRSVIIPVHPYLCCINHHQQQSFASVPITPDGVETISFLEAADGLMDLFGKSITSLQQLRHSLNPLPPIKISWAALSLDSSRRISEVILPYVRPCSSPDSAPPFFLLVSNAQHFRGSALGTTLTNPRQKLSRTSFGLRRGRAGRRA
jgi:hypothetical protein